MKSESLPLLLSSPLPPGSSTIVPFTCHIFCSVCCVSWVIHLRRHCMDVLSPEDVKSSVHYIVQNRVFQVDLFSGNLIVETIAMGTKFPWQSMSCRQQIGDSRVLLCTLTSRNCYVIGLTMSFGRDKMVIRDKRLIMKTHFRLHNLSCYLLRQIYFRVRLE